MVIKKRMKAAMYKQYGGPDVITYGEVPIPEVGPDEVLIRVAATSYNPLDSIIRSGAFKNVVPIEFPYIPHSDVSGIIETVGEAVTELKAGQRVYAYLDIARNGAAAQYVVSKVEHVALAPTSLSLQDAASIPLAMLTAWQSLFEYGNLKQGQSVLIVGASGGVGTFSVQLAKWSGAYVIGTSSEKNLTSLKELGVDESIAYNNQSITAVLKDKVDVILNLSPAPTSDVNTWLPLLKKEGIFVSAVSPADNLLATELGVTAHRIRVRRDKEILTTLANLVDGGSVVPVISEKLTFDKLSIAHRNAGKTRGKVVIEIDSTL